MKKWTLALCVILSSCQPAFAINQESGFDNGPLNANQISVECGNFSNNLTCADKDVQHALNTIDQLTTGGGSGSGNVGIGTATWNAIYAANGSTVTANSVLRTVGSNIGIGSATPGTTLDVSGSMRSRGTNQHYFGDDNKADIEASAATTPDLIFKNNSTETVRLTNGNRVGIGTSVPANILDVKGGGSFGTYAGVNTGSANGLVVSGNMGVGTYNPSASLCVGSTCQFAVSSAGGVASLSGDTLAVMTSSTLSLRNSGATATIQQVGSSGNSHLNIKTGSGAGSSMLFFTANSQRAILDGSGNLGIGTTAPNGKFVVASGNVGIGTGIIGALLNLGGACATQENVSMCIGRDSNGIACAGYCTGVLGTCSACTCC